MAIKERQVNNLQELISASLEVHSALPANSFLWYRGISCHNYQLLPKIMRDGKGHEVRACLCKRELNLQDSYTM